MLRVSFQGPIAACLSIQGCYRWHEHTNEWWAHLLDLRHVSGVCTRHALSIVHSLAVVLLRLLLSLLALVLGLVLLLHVLDVGAGIPVCWHLRNGKIPLATCGTLAKSTPKL